MFNYRLGHSRTYTLFLCLITGSDIPGLTSDVMEEAFETLEGGADMVLGQAEDGGYYLVGFSKKAAHKIGTVFMWWAS